MLPYKKINTNQNSIGIKSLGGAGALNKDQMCKLLALNKTVRAFIPTVHYVYQRMSSLQEDILLPVDVLPIDPERVLWISSFVYRRQRP